MSDKIYDVISFRKYQIDRPRDPNRVYNPYFRPDIDHPEDFVYTKSYLDGKLPTLAKLACEYAFNKKLTSGGNAYNVCIEFTKHFLCVSLCWERSSNDIYFVDIDVDLLNSTREQIKVKEIKAFKLNRNNLSCLNIMINSYTVGYTFGNPPNTMPYKLPIIGISNKKLFLPRLSFFIEGPHINLYKQNYLFDWRYPDYYSSHDPDPRNPDEKDEYEYNLTTENIESGAPFNQYKFNISKS